MSQDETSESATSILNKPRFSPSKTTAISDGYQALGRKYFPVLGPIEDLTTYRSLKADILESAQIQILKYALLPSKLEKSGFLQLCQGFEILNKALRLDANLSTENISTRTFGNVTLTLPTDNEGK